MTENLPVSAPDDSGEFILCQTEYGQTRIDVRMAHDTVWITQRDMADLFQTTSQNITQHVAAIYEEGNSRSRQPVRISYKFDPRRPGRSSSRSSTTTSTSLSPSATASARIAARSSASGRPSGCANTSSRGSRWTTPGSSGPRAATTSRNCSPVERSRDKLLPNLLEGTRTLKE